MSLTELNRTGGSTGVDPRLLKSGSGSSLVGFSYSTNYTEGSIGEAVTSNANQSGFVFKKTVKHILPFKFPDYDVAYAFVGSPSYIYPQGHCYDATGNIYIKYARGSYSVIVWYTSSGTYGGYFYIQAGGESLVLNVTGSGAKMLYSKGGSNRMYSYNITSMPANGSIVPHTDVGIDSVGLQYAYEAGRWVVEQIGPDVGAEGSRTKWNVYNGGFQFVGEFYAPKTIVGWQLPSSPLYNYVPKSQGVCLRKGRMIFGIGGSYIPESDGPVSKPVAAVGVAEVALDGTLLNYGTLNAAKLITKLTGYGYSAIRTESEGVTVRPDGSLCHLIVTANPTTPNNDQYGILLMTELDPGGLDYQGASEPYVPFDPSRLSSGVFPRGVLGGLVNPLTGADITAVSELLDFVREVQLPSVSWYTSAVSLTTLAGLQLPASSFVDVRNANNLTFIVSVTGVNSPNTNYSVTYSSATSTYSVTQLSSDPSAILLGTGGGGTDASGKLLGRHREVGEEGVQVISTSSTAANNSVIIGGGSSLFNAATVIDFYTATDGTTLSGDHRLRIDNAGVVRPGTDNLQSLGSSSRRWSVVYAGTGAINTSDEGEKTRPFAITDAVLDAWGRVQLITYQWIQSILTKGEDTARWHFGVIAQQVRDAFEAHGIDGTQFGLLCYDEWEDEYAPKFARRKVTKFVDGAEVTIEEEYDTGDLELAVPAGKLWGIRPEQCLFLEAAYQRRRCDRIEARLLAAGI